MAESEILLAQPSDSELAILGVLWEMQPCSVREVHVQIVKTRSVGYTTVLKQIQRLCEKGLVARVDGDGKAHLFRAVQQQDVVRSRLIDRLLQGAFSGSTSDLVMHALGKRKPSEEDAAEIRSMLDAWDRKGE